MYSDFKSGELLIRPGTLLVTLHLFLLYTKTDCVSSGRPNLSNKKETLLILVVPHTVIPSWFPSFTVTQ